MKVLLATDLSQASDLAATWALDLARRMSAELLILSVIDAGELRVPGPARFGLRVDQVRARREAAARELVASAGRQGVGVEFLVWEGEAGPAIVEAAAAESVDLVIVGSHGRGRFGRLFMGSVSAHVVEHAPCPVLVVRAVRGSDVTARATERQAS